MKRYENEKLTARLLYVDQGKTAKEISIILNITDKTVGRCVNEGSWKDARKAKVANPIKQLENIHEIISSLAEERIQKQNKIIELISQADSKNELDETRKEIAKIDNAVSQWSSTLAKIDKENKISLRSYINIMDHIFSAMKEYDEKLFLLTIEFQQKHLNDIPLTFK